MKKINEGLMKTNTIMGAVGGGALGGIVATPIMYYLKKMELKKQRKQLESNLSDPNCDENCLKSVRHYLMIIDDQLLRLSDSGSKFRMGLAGAAAGAVGGALGGAIGSVKMPDIVPPKPAQPKPAQAPVVHTNGTEIEKSPDTPILTEISPNMVTGLGSIVGGAIGAGGVGVNYMMKKRKLMRDLSLCTTDECKAAVRNQLNDLASQSIAGAAVAGTVGAVGGYGLSKQGGAIQTGMADYKKGATVGQAAIKGMAQLPGVNAIYNSGLATGRGEIGGQGTQDEANAARQANAQDQINREAELARRKAAETAKINAEKVKVQQDFHAAQSSNNESIYNISGAATLVEQAVDMEEVVSFAASIPHQATSSRAKVYGYMCAAFEGDDRKQCMIGAATKLLQGLENVAPDDPGAAETVDFLNNYITQMNGEMRPTEEQPTMEPIS